MDTSFEQSINPIFFFVAFAVLLVVSHFVRRNTRANKLLRQGQLSSSGGSAPSIEQRVANNKCWAKGAIPSSGKGVVYLLWVATIVLNFMSTIPFVRSLVIADATTPQRVILGVFSIFGIAVAVFAVRATIRWYRFGQSLCCIETKAGVLGQSISGKIRTQNQIAAEGDFKVRIQCIETYSTGSGKNRKTHTNVRWEQEQLVPHGGKNSIMGIPFSFKLPTQIPETGDQLSRGDIDWQINIHAPVKGVDYAARFIVPVFKMS